MQPSSRGSGRGLPTTSSRMSRRCGVLQIPRNVLWLKRGRMAPCSPGFQRISRCTPDGRVGSVSPHTSGSCGGPGAPWRRARQTRLGFLRAGMRGSEVRLALMRRRSHPGVPDRALCRGEDAGAPRGELLSSEPSGISPAWLFLPGLHDVSLPRSPNEAFFFLVEGPGKLFQGQEFGKHPCSRG